MKKLLVAVGVAGIAVGGWKLHSRSAATDSGKTLVTDRLWIDHLPRSERDTFNVFAALSDQEVGVFQETSRWQGRFELFTWELRGKDLRVVFPHTGSKETLKTNAKKCNEKGFDFCLELDGGSHGVKRYYSMEGWEAGNADAVQHEIVKLEAAAK